MELISKRYLTEAPLMVILILRGPRSYLMHDESFIHLLSHSGAILNWFIHSGSTWRRLMLRKQNCSYFWRDQSFPLQVWFQLHEKPRRTFKLKSELTILSRHQGGFAKITQAMLTPDEFCSNYNIIPTVPKNS